MEYHGFRQLPDFREYRLTAYGLADPVEFCFRVPLAAFADGRIRLQEAPDLCYQRLLQLLLLGDTAQEAPVVFDDVELAGYREAHTVTPRRRAANQALPAPPFGPFRPPQVALAPPRPAPPARTAPVAVAGLGEGQRVSHATFGAGVTVEANASRTTVHFDETGPRTFVSSMVVLEVLSPPNTWKTDRRGNNKPLVIDESR